MQNELYTKLIARAKSLRFAPVLNIEEIVSVEKTLKVIFPQDFKDICLRYDYEYIGPFEMYNFSLDDQYSVKGGTISWRNNIGLPNNYIVLAENGSSAVIMKIIDKTSNIIWCALEDVLNICDGTPMKCNPTIFPSFTDFFEFLVNEEEKIQKEEED